MLLFNLCAAFPLASKSENSSLDCTKIRLYTGLVFKIRVYSLWSKDLRAQLGPMKNHARGRIALLLTVVYVGCVHGAVVNKVN